MAQDQVLENLITELRRGTIVLGVLSLLKEPHYGYALVTLMNTRDIPVEPGTLYPLLRRLEEQNILASTWDVKTPKPRKYYSLSEYGQEVYIKLCAHWSTMTKNINELINNGE